MYPETQPAEDLTEIRSFLLSERDKSLSETEWRFRMRGYGYTPRRTERGMEVARLPQNAVLGTLEI